MCLPTADYQNFDIIKGFKVFVPAIVKAFRNRNNGPEQVVFDYQAAVEPVREHNNLERKREAAKRHQSQPVFRALRAQDSRLANETIIYRRRAKDGATVVIGSIKQLSDPRTKFILGAPTDDFQLKAVAA